MVQVRNRVFRLSVAGVPLAGLLIPGGLAVHRLGWSQGYTAAEIAPNGGEVPSPPLAPPGWRPVLVEGPGSVLLYLALGLLFFALAGRLLRLIVWGAVAGPVMQWHPGACQVRYPRHRWHRNGPAQYGPWWACPAAGYAVEDESANREE